MKHSEAPPPISKDKARRLGIRRSRRWIYLVSFLLIGSVVATGGAYAVLSHAGSSTSTTSSATNTSSISSASGLQATSVRLVCSPSPQMVGAGSSCIATVSNSPGSGHSATPSGVVNFASGSAGAYGAITCASSYGTLVCSSVYTPKLGTEGNHNLTATYAGDSGHSGSSNSFTLHASKRPSAVNDNCSPETLPVNTKSKCIATVADTGGGTRSVPSGSVDFALTSSGTFTSLSCTLSAGSCSVEFMPSSGQEGPISLPTAYGGDADHFPSKGLGTDVLSATVRGTTALVSCIPSISSSGSQVACMATVKDSSGSGVALIPKGNFSFSTSGGGNFSPASCSLVALTSDSSACTVHYAPATGSIGSQQIGGKYGGDVDHSSATATPFTLQIRARASSLSLSCGSGYVTVNTPIGCTATVTDVSGLTPQTPTGWVGFETSRAGSFSPSACTIHSGSCSVTYTPRAGSEGGVTITASYSGDANFGSSSGTAVISVDQRLSSMTLGCAPSTVPVNAPTTCTAKVSDSTSVGISITPTGTVTFSSLGGTFGSGASCSLSAGTCSVTFTPTPGSEGAVLVEAGYSGDVDHYSSAASVGVTATTRSVTVSVMCAPSSIFPAQSTTCTVTVTDFDTGSPIVPTGTVHFSANVSGTFTPTDCTLSSGSCSVSYSTPTIGPPTTIAITATYSGDTDHPVGSDVAYVRLT